MPQRLQPYNVLYWMFAFCILPTLCLSQNLVPNPSFEFHTSCPTFWGQLDLAVPWVYGNAGSSDYFHTCGPPEFAGVPLNGFGNQWPYTGMAYAGGYARHGGGGLEDYREYLLAPLESPLVPGSAYFVSFYISLGDESCPIQPFGALFTVDPPVYDFNQVLDEYIPQVEVNGEYLGDYSGWMLISRCFVAEGGEQYITIGNFRNDANTPPAPDCVNQTPIAYYYIDSVSVVEMPLSEDEFVLDPVETCPPYTIYPGTAQNYQWSDGTTNPTLIVTESGTYYVTLSNECAFSYGEIEVTILSDAPPVSLPNDTLVCTGESLEISLDPDAGDYEWNDGSTDSDYVISGPGEYIVELTDECDVTEDTIVVDFLDAPEPFSLGEDTLICDGDAFTIALDPSLGDFEWQDGNSSSSYTINDDGAYALTISNMCGEAEDEIQVDFVEPIVFSIGPDQMILCDGDEVEIELDPELGDFLWHDESDGNTFTISEAGIVSVTVANACYTETDEMLVDVLYQPVFTLGPDIIVCSGQFPITLDLSGVQHAQSWEWTGGSTASIYQITAPGTYGVTISNDCFAMSDEIVITVGDVDPVVTLPADQLLCEGQTYVLDAGGLIGNYQWQDFSSADTFLVTQAGTYSLTVTNICGSGADTVVIDYMQDLAPPDLGPDFSLCPGETGVLYGNVDDVSYLWYEGTTGTPIAIGGTADSLVVVAPGTYSLLISDACSSASDTVVVTADSNPPDVDLPDVVDLCQGDSVVIDAGITGVQYQWEGGTATSSMTIYTPGTYGLTVSNACGMDIDSVVINNAGAEPLVMLGEDISLCPGDVTEIIPAAMDVDTWLWQDSSTSSSLIASTGGIVHVTGTNQCGTSSDTIVVIMLPDVPVLDLGEDIAICPGETVTLAITEVDVEIEWHDATTDSLFLVNDEGLVHATITNACGSSSDTVMVELLPAIPDLDLGADLSLCPGETITLDPAIPDVEYLWQDGSDEAIYETSIPGAIILTISNACGSSTDTVVVIEDTNGPQVDLGEDILACEGDTVILDAEISGVEYLWQDGSAGSMFNVQSSGTFILHVSNQCGMDSDTILVDIHGTVPNPSLGADTTLCDGEVLTLISDADAETSIEWQNGSALSSFLVSEEGMYSLTETNHCGSASDTIVVIVQSAPAGFDLGEDVVICPGDSIVLHAPLTTDLLTWQDGSHDASFIADQEQVYVLQISNDCGIANDEVVISFDHDVPVIDLESSLSICHGQSVILDVTQSFNASYLWSTGSTLTAIRVTIPGDYFVSVMTNCYFLEGSVLVSAEDDCNPNIYIPNVFSPNGDGINDTWEVLIDPSVDVNSIECTIFDRWGNALFAATSVPVKWDGTFKGEVIMSGVYVYVMQIYTEDGEIRLLSGDLTLVR